MDETMTELTQVEVKQPKFLMMKRVWLAIIIPVMILYFGGIKNLVQLSFVWIFICMILLMLAYKKFRVKKWNAGTRDLLNEKGDGIWFHEFGPTSLRIDEKNEVIHLKEEGNRRTYPFALIKEWRYNLTHSREKTGTEKELDRRHNFQESGFYVLVDDVQFPEWRIMFFPTKGDFNSQEGIRNTELQMKRWMHIFEKVINKA